MTPQPRGAGVRPKNMGQRRPPPKPRPAAEAAAPAAAGGASAAAEAAAISESTGPGAAARSRRWRTGNNSPGRGLLDRGAPGGQGRPGTAAHRTAGTPRGPGGPGRPGADDPRKWDSTPGRLPPPDGGGSGYSACGPAGTRSQKSHDQQDHAGHADAGGSRGLLPLPVLSRLLVGSRSGPGPGPGPRRTGGRNPPLPGNNPRRSRGCPGRFFSLVCWVSVIWSAKSSPQATYQSPPFTSSRSMSLAPRPHLAPSSRA